MAVSEPDMALRTPRIPKLTYRNPLPHSHSTATVAQLDPAEDSLHHHIDTITRHPSTPEDSHPSSDSRSVTSSIDSSLASSHVSTSKSSKTSSKKKKNAVFGFLTVKEPSQAALEQFAKSQHQQPSLKSSTSSIKSGSSMPVGAQQISNQKLPSNVPRVNSKWDGLPDSVKSPQVSKTSSMRSSASSDGDRSMFGGKSTFDTASVMSAASRGPPPSLASTAASVADAIDGPVLESSTAVSSNSSSQISLPDRSSSLQTSLPNRSSSLQASLPDTSSRSSNDTPLISGTLSSSSQYWDSSIGSQDIVGTHELEDPDLNGEAEAIFRKLQGGNDSSSDEGHAHAEYAEHDLVDGVPETHEFLFDLATPVGASASSGASAMSPSSPSPSSSYPNSYGSPVTPPSDEHSSQFVERPARLSPSSFSRPRPVASRSQSFRMLSSTLPTLYEASVASTDTITEYSDDTETETRRSIDTMSIAESTADSLAPSVMSASWSRTSKDRLGLGIGRLRKSDTLPWEMDDKPASGKLKKGRLSVFSKFSA